LFGEHALFEIGVLFEAFTEEGVGVHPPCFASEEREEVMAGGFGEGLADERDGKEEPAEGVAAPL